MARAETSVPGRWVVRRRAEVRGNPYQSAREVWAPRRSDSQPAKPEAGMTTRGRFAPTDRRDRSTNGSDARARRR